MSGQHNIAFINTLFLHNIKPSMKKFFFILLLVSGMTSYAQKGFFIQPIVGMGLTATSVVPQPEFFGEKDESRFSYDPQLLVGYRYNNFIFKTGITYLKTGATGVVEQDPFLEAQTLYRYYYYVSVPLSLGYCFRINPRFSITSSLFYSLGFKTSVEKTVATFVTSSPASSYAYSSESTERYAASGTRSFAGITIEAEYMLNSKFSISAGPQAQYKFSATFPDNTDFFRPYTYTFNAGFKYYLTHK